MRRFYDQEAKVLLRWTGPCVFDTKSLYQVDLRFARDLTPTRPGTVFHNAPASRKSGLRFNHQILLRLHPRFFGHYTKPPEHRLLLSLPPCAPRPHETFRLPLTGPQSSTRVMNLASIPFVLA